MNREDIILMAREAGAMFDHITWFERDLAPVFERFATLVASAEREAIAKEWDCKFYGDLEEIDIGDAIRKRSKA